MRKRNRTEEWRMRAEKWFGNGDKHPIAHVLITLRVMRFRHAERDDYYAEFYFANAPPQLTTPTLTVHT